MIGVVLVAGISRRLYPLTVHRPKCLLEAGSKTIFDHQMNALRACGVREVCLVLGYRREQILEHAQREHADLRFTSVTNHHFFETNTAQSLHAAGKHFLDRDMVLLNGDVLFDPRVIERVVKAPHAVSMAVEAKPCGDEEVKVIVDGDGRIQEIGKEIDIERSLGEFIGVARFSATTTGKIYQSLSEVVSTEDGRRNAYYERALAEIVDDVALTSVEVTGLPCVEIDFPEDYEVARRDIFPRFAT